MIRRIVPLMFLVLLPGCKELYFKTPQPKGGEQYKGDLIQYLTNSLPNRMTSNDNNSLLKDAVNDTLVYIEINQDLITVQIRMKFYNDLIWMEEFDLNDFLHDNYDFISEIDLNKSIILEKENIICVNKKSDEDYYKIDFILEKNRKNGDIMCHMVPFFGISDDYEKFFGNRIDDFDITEHYDNDSSKIYIVDPSYISFRWLLKRWNDSDENLFSQSFTNVWIEELFNDFESRVELDSTKYKDITGLLNFKSFSIVPQ